MKLKEGFILREVGEDTVVVPADEIFDMNLMITLNDTGCFLWKLLESETTVEELLEKVLSEYDTDEQTALQFIENFIRKLDENGFLQ